MRISIAAFAFCGLGATTALSTSAAVGSVTHSTLVHQMCNSYNTNYVFVVPQNLSSVSASLTTGDFNVVVELYSNASLTQMIANGFGNSDANTSITTFSGAFIYREVRPGYPPVVPALYSECTSTVLKLDPTGTGLAKIVCKVYVGAAPTVCTATYSFAPAEKGQIEQSTHE